MLWRPAARCLRLAPMARRCGIAKRTAAAAAGADPGGDAADVPPPRAGRKRYARAVPLPPAPAATTNATERDAGDSADAAALASALTDPGWRAALAPAFSAPSFAALAAFVASERRAGTVFPPPASVFAALNACPLHAVTAVILGQDPYHAPGQAMGLAFSVPAGIRIPSSLQNIHKELAASVDVARPTHGDLSPWAPRGVLLLNAVLTVRSGTPNSHAGRGWEEITDAALAAVGRDCTGVAFLLWGAKARAKRAGVEAAGVGKGHLILEAPHPSGLSAHRGFLGCGHFGAANDARAARGEPPIDWSLGP